VLRMPIEKVDGRWHRQA